MNDTPSTGIARLEPGPRMSKAVCHAGVVYLCGQTSGGTALLGVEEQTAEVLARIDALLQRAGSNRTRLLSALIHLRDMGDFGAMNAVWESWLPAGAAPARTTVQAALALPSLRVEITVTAALQQSRCGCLAGRRRPFPSRARRGSPTVCRPI